VQCANERPDHVDASTAEIRATRCSLHWTRSPELDLGAQNAPHLKCRVNINPGRAAEKPKPANTRARLVVATESLTRAGRLVGDTAFSLKIDGLDEVFVEAAPPVFGALRGSSS